MTQGGWGQTKETENRKRERKSTPGQQYGSVIITAVLSCSVCLNRVESLGGAFIINIHLTGALAPPTFSILGRKVC